MVFNVFQKRLPIVQKDLMHRLTVANLSLVAQFKQGGFAFYIQNAHRSIGINPLMFRLKMQPLIDIFHGFIEERIKSGAFNANDWFRHSKIICPVKVAYDIGAIKGKNKKDGPRTRPCWLLAGDVAIHLYFLFSFSKRFRMLYQVRIRIVAVF